jgi:hypothetical protein
MKLLRHDSEPIITIQHPVCLVTGDGRTLRDDLARFSAWDVAHDTMAIGRSYQIVPGQILHWVNVDGSCSKSWAESLPRSNNGNLPHRHTMGDLPGYDIDWDIDGCPWDPKDIMWHGSSSLFATYICKALGYDKVVLAGCPLDSAGHWYFGPEIEGPSWTGNCFQAWLDFARDPYATRVRSMSGYTAQMIGEASKEWVAA